MALNCPDCGEPFYQHDELPIVRCRNAHCVRFDAWYHEKAFVPTHALPIHQEPERDAA